MKQTPALAQALTNLRNHPDFQVYLQALATEGEQLVEKLLMMPSGGDVDVVRGQAREVTLLLKAISEAPKMLGQFKNSTR